jgi:hypothetical protein
MTTMNGRRFGALLQREWMQHQRGWWVVMAVPVIVLLLVAIYGDVNITLDADDDTSVIRTPSALLMAMGSLGGLAIGNLALSWFRSCRPRAWRGATCRTVRSSSGCRCRWATRSRWAPCC